MEDSNDYDYPEGSNPNETSSTIHGSPSEDESINDNNDEDFVYNELHDDDIDEVGSSSDAEFVHSPVITKKSNVIDIDDEKDEEESINKCETKSLQSSTSNHRNKRSSGRVRKDEKISTHAKNLFPGRPRIRMKKFALNYNLNISENIDKTTSSSVSEAPETDQSNDQLEKNETQQSTTTDLIESNESNKNQVYQNETVATQSTDETNSIVETRNASKVSAVAKKKLNYSGKSKGKLAGRRNKTMEYRKKRGPKKFKNFASVSQSFPSTSDPMIINIGSATAADDKQDDSNENKIILCSSKDNYVLSQDVCVMCGSLGKGEEGRLLSCAQCGQCYHPFCASIKLTKMMLKKGWRCLECTVCEGCGKPTDESRLLLCDDCDISYHTYCLNPPLEEVPQGTWKCKWCVVCVKCKSTEPGYGSHWQENYTCCGPCASQEKCSACKQSYNENDLIIQCNQCSRWLHSKCDSMFDENECEIASSIGYNCLNCRPKNEPPPHIQARKNGTLRSIFNKKRAEERNDPTLLMKKNETTPIKTDLTDLQNSDSNNENSVNSKLLSKNFVDGVFLSDAGLAMIKQQQLEQPKKTRVKRKNANKDESDESFNNNNGNNNNNKELDDSIIEENGGDGNKQQSEEEKKKRSRQIRLDKLGIGGFSVKQRSRLSFDDDTTTNNSQDLERSITPENNTDSDKNGNNKPRRRRRIIKKKNQLQDQYPSYLRDAFFGKVLLDVMATNNNNDSEQISLSDDDSENEDNVDDEQNTIGMDKIINLNLSELSQNIKPQSSSSTNNNKNDSKNDNKNDDQLNFLDENFQTENFEDFAVLSPDDAFVHMLNGDEVLNELTADDSNDEDDTTNNNNNDNSNSNENSNNVKNETESKIVMDDLLNSNFNLNELNDDTGLPQMDSKDVEDLFEGISSSSSVVSMAATTPVVVPPPPPPSSVLPSQPVVPPPSQQQQIPKEYQQHHHHSTAIENKNVTSAMIQQPKSNVETLDLPMINPPSSIDHLSDSSTPVTPMSGDSLSSLQQQFSTFNPNPSNIQNSMYKIASQPNQVVVEQQQQQQPQHSQNPNLHHHHHPHPPPTQGPPSDYYMPTPEQDSEGTTQLQKNLIKWEAEEALGQYATISAVLYSNMNHPELQKEYPNFADRFKQIHKIWRQLPSDQRAPYLQMARDNRSQNKKNQADITQKNNINQKNKLDGDKQWKDNESINMNVPHQSNELGFPEYGPPNNPNRYPPGSMPMQPQQQQHSGPMPPQLSPNPMIQMQQAQQSPMVQSPHHHPSMSPVAMHSPRLRHYGSDNNYVQQQQPPRSPAINQQQHGQIPMMRQQSQPGSFSPSSLASQNECYQLSPGGGNTPQRSQSTDLQQHYGPYSGGRIPSPYGPGSSQQKPYSPVGMQPLTPIPNDPYHQLSPSMETAPQNVYKVKMGPQQHQIQKPHTPDGSYIPQSPMPATPQPPASSPQLTTASPINDIYARSPSTPRSQLIPTSNQQATLVRQSSQPPFEDSNYNNNNNNNQRQIPELYTPNAPNTNPQFMQQPQQQSYNMPDASLRPNMINNMNRPTNIPMRRAQSDPYTRQPLPPGSVGNVGMDDNQQHDPHSKQHLRNLLQVQQMRRHDSQPNNPQMWQDNPNNNFRQPISPAINRNRLPMTPANQQIYSMEQQQRLMMHRNPVASGDIRFRPIGPQQQQQPPPPQQTQQPGQFGGRFPQQQHPQPMTSQQQMQQLKQQQQGGPMSRLQSPSQQSQPQNWPANTSTAASSSHSMSSHPNQMNPMIPQMSPNNNPTFQQSQQNNSNNKATSNPQQTSTAMVDVKMPITNEIINAEDVEEALPVELADDDELLQLANDFNILEYADPELDSKTVIGQSGKSNIFDELEPDILTEKDKDSETDKAVVKSSNEIKTELVTNISVEKSSNESEQNPLFNQMNYGNPNSNPNETNRIYVQNKQNTVSSTEMDPGTQTNKHEQTSSYFQNECFLSDDDFERLKNDCLNDSNDQINPGIQSPNQMNASYSVPPQIQQHQHRPTTPGSGLISSQPPLSSSSHQVYQQPCQYNPSMNPGQPPQQHQHQQWIDKQQFNQRMAFQNRMNLRIPMNPQSQQPPSPSISRHMQPQGSMYPQPGGGGNRMPMMQKPGGVSSGNMPSSNPPMMRQPSSTMVVNDSNNEHNAANALLQRQKHFEGEIGKLRKIKKSLNAKQRQCRKNQNDLPENEAQELMRVTQEINNLQKQLEPIRKLVRQNPLLQEKRKTASNINLPHSPSTQTSPRSVNSPLAVLSTSGPGTPGVCSSTPQSPSLTSPSPSSLIQNSPISSLHSPASMMPPSPMPNNPSDGMVPSVRPQIVQDDNNPFSDVYLQKEKKQTMPPQPPSNMYSTHPTMIKDQPQSMYPNNFDDSNLQQPGPPPPPPLPQQQQYYHSQPPHPSGSQYPGMGNMRPQQSVMNFPGNNNGYRFQSGANLGTSMNPHFAGQPPQSPQINYQQQMRRPPPPPYPGNPQLFNQRGSTGGSYSSNQPQQVRIQPPIQRTNSLECNINQPPPPPTPQMPSHSIYQDVSSPMMQPNDPSSFNSNPLNQMGPIVGEAETTMEFNFSEDGNGVDNESDPFTFLKEMTAQENRPSSSNMISNVQSFNQTTNNNNRNIGDSGNYQNISSNYVTSNVNSNQFNSISNDNQTIHNNNTNTEDNSESSNSNAVPKSNLNSNQTSDVVGDTQTENFPDNPNIIDDDSFKMENSNVKPNALLKKLLQNCPSADLKSLNEKNQGQQSTSSSSIDAPSFDNSLDEQQQQQQQQNETEIVTPIDEPNTENVDNEQKAKVLDKNNEANNNNNNNSSTTNDDETTTNTSTSETTPTLETPPIIVEKKLSYLDIRRAQLEKEPTPPLEDIKPKRKRTVKRKESNKSLDGGGDSMDSNQNSNNNNNNPNNSNNNNSNSNHNATNKIKKRTRKGSQTKSGSMEQDSNSLDSITDNEKKLTTIKNHLSTLSIISTTEPEVKINLNVCLPPDAGDFNSKKQKLKGCYGNACLSSAIDYYSTYPFGPNKPISIMNNDNSNANNQIGYYNDEFGRSILDLKEHIKEEKDINCKTLSLYCRDVDSPETIISASSPELDLYDQPTDEYNKMQYIKDEDSDSDDEERKSPFLKFLPIHRPIPLYSSSNEMAENNKENLNENLKSKYFKGNIIGMPLRESGNVEITLTVNSGRDVKNVMRSLAKLLNIRRSFTYNIENSPSSQITEVFEILDDNENINCKFCNRLISKDQIYKFNESDFGDKSGDFCSKECFKNNNICVKDEICDDPNDDSVLEQNDAIENEIASIFSNNSIDQANEDKESIISIHEKHWKNTKYLYWNSNAFKNENKIQTVEEEPVEELLDRLDMCLKASESSEEKRYCLFCHIRGDGNVDGPSRLLNMDVDKWVHLNCALWSNEVYEMCNGALMNIDLAYQRAMNTVCVRCSKFGASIRCFKLRCSNTYHFPCAIREKCVFYTDKTLFCPAHCSKTAPLFNAEEMTSFIVNRRVYVNRDEQKQIAAMLHQGEENNLIRIGSLIFLNIGQLLPHQLQNFHTNSYIYPIGYKVCRFYWSSRKLGKRCQYVCSIDELDGKPQFSIEIQEEGYENVTYKASTPKLAWEKIIDSIVKLREDSQTIKVFFDFISGEDLFGLNEPAIIRILESLPGVDTLYDYTFKYGRSPWYELPLAINPSGCARCEPRKRFSLKRSHTLHVPSNSLRSSLHSPLANTESTSPYVKPMVQPKVSQYKKMKQEWQKNVYLGRSRVSGLGLFASRDIEKNTMIIEYIGLVIRNAIADRNERIYEAHNRGIYMFRLDDNRVIDATLQGGLARYINHSCNPNCVAECVQIEKDNKILIIANRRIQKGEELTYDYKFDVEDDQHKIPCLCGAVNCRKWMN